MMIHLIWLLIWALLCLTMAVFPRRAIRLERRIFSLVRLRKIQERPISRGEALLTRCLGAIFGLGGLILAGAILLPIEAAPLKPVAPGSVSRSVPQWNGFAPRPISDALRTSITLATRPLIDSGNHVGIVVGVIHGSREGEILGFGRKALDKEGVPDANTLFELGSVTKVFTATVFSCLMQKGEVRLEQPVQDLLPSSAKMPEFQGTKITCLDLVTHTSGLPRMPEHFFTLGDYLSANFILNPYKSYTQEKMLRFLRDYHLARMPGGTYEYSNLGMGLLGLALSLKEKKPYEQLVTQLVCEPLGMKDTVITLSPAQRARLAQGYLWSSQSEDQVVGTAIGPIDMQNCFAGAGALRSTATDMVKFMAANLGLVENPIREALERTHIERRDADRGMRIAMAWHTWPKVNGAKGPALWHNGETMGYHAFLAIDKSGGNGVVVLSNTAASVDKAGIAILEALTAQNKRQAARAE